VARQFSSTVEDDPGRDDEASVDALAQVVGDQFLHVAAGGLVGQTQAAGDRVDAHRGSLVVRRDARDARIGLGHDLPRLGQGRDIGPADFQEDQDGDDVMARRPGSTKRGFELEVPAEAGEQAAAVDAVQVFGHATSFTDRRGGTSRRN